MQALAPPDAVITGQVAPPREALVLLVNPHLASVDSILIGIKLESEGCVTFKSIKAEDLNGVPDGQVVELLHHSKTPETEQMIQTIRVAAPLIRAMYRGSKIEERVNASLFNALRNLKEFGTLFMENQELVKEITAMVGLVLKGRDEHSMFNRMLCLPSLLNPDSVPLQRSHWGRDDATSNSGTPLCNPQVSPDASSTPPRETLALLVNTVGTSLDSVLLRIEVASVGPTRLTALKFGDLLDMSDGTVAERLGFQNTDQAGQTIQVIRAATPVLQTMYENCQPEERVNAVLFSALRNLQEFGTIYRKKHELVNEIISRLNSLLKGRQEHPVFPKMLGLPLQFNQLPVRIGRAHRKKEGPPPNILITHMQEQGETDAGVQHSAEEEADVDPFDEYVNILQEDHKMKKQRISCASLLGEMSSQESNDGEALDVATNAWAQEPGSDESSMP